MSELSSENMRAALDLVSACLKHRVDFYGASGVVMIEFDGLERVLSEIADGYVVLGFDTFTLDGRVVQPRLDYYTDFGEGVSVDEALAACADWPRGWELWVEVILAPRSIS